MAPPGSSDSLPSRQLMRTIGFAFFSFSLMWTRAAAFATRGTSQRVARRARLPQCSGASSLHDTQRMFVGSDLSRGSSLAISPEQGRYLTTVLRLRNGDHVRVFNGRDGEYMASLQGGDLLDKRRRKTRSDSTTLRVGERLRLQPQEDTDHATLLFAAIKGKQARLAVEKATELGAAALRLVVSQRVQQGKAAGEDADLCKMRAVAVEAAEQSERLTVPLLEAPALRLSDCLSWCAASGIGALFICEERSPATVPVLAALAEFRRSAKLVNGPR